MATGQMTWLDGRFVATKNALVSVNDRGVVVGDGAFETIPVIDGAPFAATRHLRRLRRSLAALRLEAEHDDHTLRNAMTELIRLNGRNGRRLRLTVTAGPNGLGSDREPGPTTTILGSTSVIERPRSTAVVVSPWRRNEHGALCGVKSTSYGENVIALADARARGASEALLLNTAGDVSEGTGSNVFLVVDGMLVTPDLASGCLDGVTRALVIDLMGATERRVGLDDLRRAEEVFLTSSTRDVQGVAMIDDRSLGDDFGPMTFDAARLLQDLMSRDDDP